MSSALEIARDYLRRGWSPIPIPYRRKKPIVTEWQNWRLREQDLPKYFNGERQNIGVILGPASHGLTDVDLDCPEAIALAPYVLEPTKASFGRASARESHWLYQTSLGETAEKSRIVFHDPVKPIAKATVLEVRVGGNAGAQTVFPGSTHEESGESIVWEQTGDPASADNNDLLRRASLLACMCLFARYWPSQGSRHDAALTLGGFLSRAGYKSVHIKYLAEAAARTAGDPEYNDRRTAAQDAAEAHASGQKAAGYPSVKKHFGKEVADQCVKWLDYKGAREEEESQSKPENQQGRKPVIATPYLWVEPEKVPARDWLYGRRLVRKFLSQTTAAGGLGKSALEIAEALAMVAGKDLLGCRPTSALRVWHWNLEDPHDETVRRIQATAKHYGLTCDDIGDRLFSDCGREQRLVVAETLRDGAVICRPVIDDLVAQIVERQIDVVIIDPFVSCHEVAENDNAGMDLIAKEWGRVADRGNCAVEIVHHIRKGDQEVTAESSRGGKALTDACRTVRVLNRMSKEEAEKAAVENNRLYFRTFNDKANLTPPADKSTWFKLVSVCLGNGPIYGSGGDDIGVVTSWQWPDPLAGMTGADFDKAAGAIRAGRWRESVQATNWVGRAVADALGLDVGKRADKARVVGILKVWLAAGSLRVVIGEDEKRMPKKFIEVAEEV